MNRNLKSDAKIVLMADAPRSVDFAWWNLHDFAHYDPDRRSHVRWPKKRSHYEAKRDRILCALTRLFGSRFPDLLAVGEITKDAAKDVLARLPPGYGLATPVPPLDDDGFQVAVFHRLGIGFSVELPLIPSETEEVPIGTRPMIPLHFKTDRYLVRFVVCHWTSLDESRHTRERLADFLRRDIFSFVQAATPEFLRHVVVLGDLNEEPMSQIFEKQLIARRDRRSVRVRHATDRQAKRVRLYNAAWRYLGEKFARGSEMPHNHSLAGTYFKKGYGWRTLDHILVTSGLLGESPPYLDESRISVESTDLLVGDNGLPLPFDPLRDRGVSDHLPITGGLVL